MAVLLRGFDLSLVAGGSPSLADAAFTFPLWEAKLAVQQEL